jgi:hypothetical protein
MNDFDNLIEFAMGGMTMLKQQKKARKTCHARLQQVKQVNEASATTLTGRKK